jgi:PAS fold
LARQQGAKLLSPPRRPRLPRARPKVLTSNETLRRAEAASSIGTFEFNLTSKHWVWTPQVAVLFGLDLQSAPSQFNEWLAAVFPDEALKISSALETSMSSGSFYVEFRVRRPDGKLHWLAGKGQVDLDTGTDAKVLRGTYYDINERKQLEARLLSVNETLEARVAELREEAHTLEVLNRTGIAIGAELDLERLIQIVTDAGVELSGAQFGAFFYNVTREDGEAYTLYTLSGAPREAFAKFPMPRKTQTFEPTFRGTGTVRSADILADPRYGKMEPCKRGVYLRGADAFRQQPFDMSFKVIHGFRVSIDGGHQQNRPR